MSDVIKNLSLNEELFTAANLIELGFREYQNIDMANDFYFLPFQLISSGFERLMKCHICLGHYEINNSYPDPKLFSRTLGHDLLKLKKHIIDNYFKTKNKSALEDDLDYIVNDSDLNNLISLLSEFGKYARYYNLDIVTGVQNPSTDVKTEWEDFEKDILLGNPKLMEKFKDFDQQDEVNDYIIKTVVIKLEKFVRAISRQFTLGELGKLALQLSPAVSPFYTLMDSDLGTTNYREKNI
jgi:hypothetical protein